MSGILGNRGHDMYSIHEDHNGVLTASLRCCLKAVVERHPALHLLPYLVLANLMTGLPNGAISFSRLLICSIRRLQFELDPR